MMHELWPLWQIIVDFCKRGQQGYKTTLKVLFDVDAIFQGKPNHYYNMYESYQAVGAKEQKDAPGVCSPFGDIEESNN